MLLINLGLGAPYRKHSNTGKGTLRFKYKYGTRTRRLSVLLFSSCIRNTVAITVPEGVSGLCEISKI